MATACINFGLLFYNARWYDPALGRMASADTVVPGGVQGWDRYAYVSNNPVKYTDPTGHVSCTGYNWDDGPQCAYRDSMLRGGYRSVTKSFATGGGAAETLGVVGEESYTSNSSGPQQTTIDYATGKTYVSPAENQPAAGAAGDGLATAEDYWRAYAASPAPHNVIARLQYYEDAQGTVTLDSVLVINNSDERISLRTVNITGEVSPGNPANQSYGPDPDRYSIPLWRGEYDAYRPGTWGIQPLRPSGYAPNPSNQFAGTFQHISVSMYFKTSAGLPGQLNFNIR